jgi:hypothetical protein
MPEIGKQPFIRQWKAEDAEREQDEDDPVTMNRNPVMDRFYHEKSLT